MNKFFRLILTIFICLFFQTSFSYQELDRIVAIVENTPITNSDLENGIKKAKIFFQVNNIPPPSIEVIKKKVFDELIEEKLIRLYAKDYGIKVTEDDLKAVFENILQNNQMTIDDFKENLITQGTSYDEFKKNLEYEIILKKVKTLAISSNIAISEYEIEAHKKKLEKIRPDIFHLSHILIKFPNDPSFTNKTNTKEKALDIYKKINNTNFKEIAYQFSDSSDSKEGGSLGAKKKDELPEIFIDQISLLNEGEFSKPFESPNGYHILKLDKIDTLDNKKMEKKIQKKYHLKQIVLKTSEVKSEEDVKKRLLILKQQIENGVDISELAKKFSEDNSSTAGGDIGWIKQGINSTFDQVLTGMSVNDISDPIQTNIGWHIIQLMAIKEENISLDNINNEIKYDLITERTKYLYEDWIDNLKAQSFIEIRSDEND